MTFKDEMRVCVECGSQYVWTARDQAYAHRQGFYPPKRCPQCREVQKQRHRDRLHQA